MLETPMAWIPSTKYLTHAGQVKGMAAVGTETV